VRKLPALEISWLIPLAILSLLGYFLRLNQLGPLFRLLLHCFLRHPNLDCFDLLPVRAQELTLLLLQLIELFPLLPGAILEIHTSPHISCHRWSNVETAKGSKTTVALSSRAGFTSMDETTHTTWPGFLITSKGVSWAANRVDDQLPFVKIGLTWRSRQQRWPSSPLCDGQVDDPIFDASCCVKVSSGFDEKLRLVNRSQHLGHNESGECNVERFRLDRSLSPYRHVLLFPTAGKCGITWLESQPKKIPRTSDVMTAVRLSHALTWVALTKLLSWMGCFHTVLVFSHSLNSAISLQRQKIRIYKFAVYYECMLSTSLNFFRGIPPIFVVQLAYHCCSRGSSTVNNG